MFATAGHFNKSSPAAKLTGPHHLTELKCSSAIIADRRIRRERWMAFGMFAFFAALVALLMLWAVTSGNTFNTGGEGYEYWMLP